MIRLKNILNVKYFQSSNDGVILISMSIGIFLIISVFTFFLMKLVVKEHNMSMLHTLDIKTRNLSHSALERGIFQFKNFRNITQQFGNLNNGEYNISYNGVNDENNEPLPYSHYTMLEAKAEINESKRKTRIFMSSFPAGFNPAFFGENLNNVPVNSINNINGGQLIKNNGSLYYNGSLIQNDKIVEKMPSFNNFYSSEISWTENNVQPNTSNAGSNPNNKYLNFDGNDYVRVNYTNTTTTTNTITVPGSFYDEVITFEDMGVSGWKQISNGYRGMNWNYRFYALNANNYTNSGYYIARNSGGIVAYNAWNENPVWFETQNQSTFTLKGMWMASAWVGSQSVTIRGIHPNNSYTDKVFTISRYSKSWLNTNIPNVKKVEIRRGSSWFAADDITITRQNPPTTQTTTQTTTTTILPKYNETRTITVWVYPSDDHNTGGGIITTGTGDCTGKMFGIGRSNGKLFFWGGCKDWASNLSVPKNQWSFIAIRYNGSKVRAYVNDNWEETNLNGFNTQMSELFIGGETTNNGSSYRNYFRGGIDEVAIWNEALTHNEILALYNDGSGLNASVNYGNYLSKSNLVGYWKFNEGNGNAITDASGKGKNGTIYGALWQTGSHSQPQVTPLKFSSNTQLNLDSPFCGSDHTSLCVNNKIAVNEDIIFEDTDITGSGVIVSTGKIVINQNSTINGGITLISKNIEINNCSLGDFELFNSSEGPIIIYVEDGGSISNSNNISGLIINYDDNNSGNFSISNSNIYGALLNYGSNFEIINNTSIVGSVVSNYLITINDGSSITKGNLPSFYGTNFGLSPSVIPGSYLEY